MSSKQKNILFIIISGLLASIVFFIIYGEVLDPRYHAWLLTAGADPIQHYVGAIMYRFADWTFPIGVASNYAYPYGVSISYTDSIPLFAIIFKIIREILPQTFQYFGLWILACFVLQGVFGYLLLKILIKKYSLALLGSLIFVLSPPMIFRLGGHFALCGHLLLLDGLYLLFRQNKKIQYFLWTLLLALSLLVHPYLFFMNSFLLLANILNLVFIHKSVKIKQALLFLIIEIIFVLFLAYSLGLFLSAQASAPGYGDFSMNINAIVNPLGWSRILPDLGIIKYQAEGFNYLGLGIIFLLILSVIKYFKKHRLKKFWKKYWPLIIVSFILILISLSNTVALNSSILFTINLTDNIKNNIFGLFRASGRFFWPVFYLLMLASFYILRTLKYKIALLILILALALQIFDLSSILYQRGQKFEGQGWSNHLLQTDLALVTDDYQHISFLPVVPHSNYMAFALYAAQNNMTLNNGFFARPIAGHEEYISQEIKQVKAGQIKAGTIYVFSQDAEEFIKNLDMSQHHYMLVDNTYILLPYKIID
ncbi:DUF6311 domain-containing protein [bacterium]|nr:DUF6311 domain-containing protein [bacterium]